MAVRKGQAVTTVDVRSRAEWRSWLRAHHDSAAGIWLVFHKSHTGKTSIAYEDAIQEALCFGWVDSLVRRLDEDRYARKFTPRRPDSRWSRINLRRYAELEARGALQRAGRERAPTGKIAVAPPRWTGPSLPKYIEEAFRKSPAAWATFERLAPSHRRQYVGWIDSAKKHDTKERRMREAIALLAAGRKLGLK
jgi:uncharacterized protein YdeI (YjbR/CyaY-like superfamily)